MYDYIFLKKSYKFIVLLLILSMSVPVFAQPDIEILSPSNTTYSQSKILVNVTSNEVVDFYIDYGPKEINLARNATSLETYLYVKEGNYILTIHANNSNGDAYSEVIFTEASEEPPLGVTDCGIMFSPNAAYELLNDVSSDSTCFYIDQSNVSFNLNGFSIYSDYSAIESICKSSKIFNGTIYSEGFAFQLFYGTKCIIKDINAECGDFAYIEEMPGILFDSINSSITNEYAFSCSNSPCNLFIRNSDFYGQYESGSTFIKHDNSIFNEIVIENTTINNFDYDFDLSGDQFSDYYMRNTYLNISKILESGNYIRFFVQHLLKLNVTENGTGVPSIVEIVDSSTFNDPIENNFNYFSNPTGNISIATDPNGLGETWLTEKSIIYSSPPTEYRFVPYNITAISSGTNYSQILDITGNSTFRMNFSLPSTKLLPCTIDQMFDMNNDNTTDINDAILILRRITGLSVESGEEKTCRARNFFVDT